MDSWSQDFPKIRAVALADVDMELERQDKKWGTIAQGNGIGRPLQRYLILAEEVGEVATALLEHLDIAEVRAELVQVAAVAVSNIERIDAGVYFE